MPGMLQSMEPQRVTHNWVTEQQQQNSYGVSGNIEKPKQPWKKKVIEFTAPDFKILLQTHYDQ